MVAESKLSLQEQTEMKQRFRQYHSIRGGGAFDPKDIFSTPASRLRAYNKFVSEYTLTSAQEWELIPTKAQAQDVRDKIAPQGITLWTLQFSVIDETRKNGDKILGSSRMLFREAARKFIESAGFVWQFADCEGWDIPGETVVIGFIRPVPLYKPVEQPKA